MVKREAMPKQLSRSPSLCRVAVLALQAEKSGMDTWLSMALHAFGRCTGKFLLLVAFAALNIGMQTF